MAYTLTNLQDDIRNYTEVDSSVLSTAVLTTIIKNAENRIYREVDSDDNRFYATSNLAVGNRYVTIPSDLRIIRYVQLKDSNNNQVFLEKRDTSFISEYNSSDATGVPKYYANWDDLTIVMAPVPNAEYTVQINYIIDPPHFDGSNNTYLSTYQEAMLLNGVLTECFRYLKGPAELYKAYFDKYNEDVQAFALQQMGQRRRGQYEEGVPRIPIQSPSP